MMAKEKDFFGNVFDSPEEDPLLGEEPGGTEEDDSDQSEDQGPPTWMSGEQTNGRSSSTDGDSTEQQRGAQPERKEIVVEGETSEGQGLEELNEAVGQGWRLVRISLARPNGQQAASRLEAERFVAILEQESPQSLFDFGG